MLTASTAYAQSAEAASSAASTNTSYAAYSVYTYSTSPATGMAGRIVDTGGDSSTAITPHPDMSPTLTDTFTWNGDPTVQGFDLSSSALRIAVTDYTGTAGQPIRIYNATNGNLLTTVSSGWSNVANLYGLVKVGSYLYAIDYDNGRVVEINPSTYAQTGISYTLPSKTVSGTTYSPHGQALLAIGNTLYGLFSYANTGFTAYTNSELVKFSITGDFSISVSDSNSSFAQNAYALTANGSNIYVASIGGEQTAGSYNTGSAIQSISYSGTLSGVTPTTVMSPSSTYPYNFLDISFNTNTSPATAYILMGAYNSDYSGTNGVLLSTTDFTNFTTIDTISNAGGYYWAAQYTSENKRLWYARGNPIWVYDASGTGTPVNVAELTLTAGSLLSSGDPAYTNLSNFSFVDPPDHQRVLRGYRSPIQASNTAWAAKARAIAQGRPSLTKEEVEQLNSESNKE
jgi:hypothetical protein